MNIMCKIGDYILIFNNLNKTSTQANIPKRSTYKIDDSIANNLKNRKLQKVRFKVRLRILSVRLRMSNVSFKMR